jgi:hypothetical protein
LKGKWFIILNNFFRFQKSKKEMAKKKGEVRFGF